MDSSTESGVGKNRPPGAETRESLSDREREILRQVARDSILQGVEEGVPLRVPLESFPASLRAEGAAFVTLHKEGRLRGCIGSYLARRPLVEDVAQNAFAAAFRDPRFPPVSLEESGTLDLHISLLSAPESLPVGSREALLQALRPGIDGLLLEDPPHRATFLPQVWRSLPVPEEFLEELLLKSGLPRRHWSATLRFQRYEAEEF